MKSREFFGLPKLLGLKDADTPRVGWLFTHSLCVGIFASFLFCTGNAVFLGQFEARMLPWAFIASGLFGALVMRFFDRVRGRLAFCDLLLVQLGFLVAAVLGLYLAGLFLPLGYRKFVAFGLFMFIGPALTVINLEFWSLARRLFDIRQSKRFNPLVAAGEAMASITGFFLVPILSPQETLHLLVPSLGGLAGSIGIVIYLRRRFAADLVEVSPSEGADKTTAQDVPRDRYFALAAAVVGLTVTAQYLVDFIFLGTLEQRYTSADQIAAFIGLFFGVVKILDLLFKSLVSSRIVQYFGLRTALRALPVAILFSVTLALLSSAQASILFLCVALTKLLWPVLRIAVFDPAFKVLYQPLPKARSLALQSQIDGGVRQVATFLIGLVLLLISRAEVKSWALLSLLFVILVAWIVLIGPLHGEYRRRLMAMLSFRDPKPLVRSPFGELRRWILAAESEERRSATRHLAAIDPILAAAIEGDLDPQAFAEAESEFERRDDTALRCRTLDLFAMAGGARGEERLVRRLGFPDVAVRLAALEGLAARGYRAHGEIAVRLRHEIESLAGDMTWNLAALVDLELGLRDQPQLEALCEALRSDVKEQRQRVFLLLALLFDSGAIGLAREGLMASEDDGEASANALELLETLISDDIRPLVLVLVEDVPAAQALKRLERFCPSERLGWRERLGAILQRPAASFGLETRALALEAITDSCREGDIAEELLACLYHPEPLLQEVAVVSLGRLDPEETRRRLARLPFHLRQRLAPLVASADDDASSLPTTIAGRIQWLDSIDVFRGLPRAVKGAIAAKLEPRESLPDSGIAAAPVAAEAELSLTVGLGPNGRPAARLDPGSYVSSSKSAGPESDLFRPRPEEPVLYIEGFRFHELLRRHFELALTVFRWRYGPNAERASPPEHEAAESMPAMRGLAVV